MRTTRNLPGVLVLALAIGSVVVTTGAAASPQIAGLQQKHPLKPAQVGALLINELRCAACHGSQADQAPPKASHLAMPAAPSLESVGERVSPSFLKRFILNPGKADPGTAMPSVLHDLPATKRQAVADDITAFLISLSDTPWKAQAIAPKDAESGKALYHRVGCVACHNPRSHGGKPSTLPGSVSLSHVAAKYSLPSLSKFLFEPHKVRPGGRMPDMRLKPQEAVLIASYLITSTNDANGPTPEKHGRPTKPDEASIARGRTAFANQGCISCHPLASLNADAPRKLAPRWSKLNPTRGCLDPKTTSTPRYDLDPDQADAIRAAIKAGDEEAEKPTQLAMTLTAFNCIACHSRDDYGGPGKERNDYFTTDEPNLGDHGRIPPTLTLLGAKLKTLWLQKVLYDGEAVRPHMHTRMPQFGEANIGHLPKLFKSLDKLPPSTTKPLDPSEPGRNDRRTYRDAGSKLLGDQGLNCITCHNFNGLKSPGFKGMDLMTTFDRLEPAWFDAFLRSPLTMRPGIIMPNYWPEGKAVRTDILQGNTEQQIRALWYTLSLGRSAPTPRGIRREGTKLLVTDAARLYRGRSRVAGYRGIAVGLPGGLNYAFNAENGSLTALWRGEFVSVNWGGQGAGNFDPAARATQLAQDVGFYRLPSEQAPWPLRPVMTKEQPVNPDPLYPRNRGYQFLGYSLNDAGPTLRYRSGDVEITDRSVATKKDGDVVMQRTLTFKAPKAETVWLRALTGLIESDGQSHRVGKTTITLPKNPIIGRSITRAMSGKGLGGKELLLQLKLPAGESSLEVTYDIQP